jgi:protein dithiol:quinone oxidoreductase
VSFFLRIGQSKLYWLAMIVIGLALEGIALYYQYALKQYPCVLCIHIRIWVLAFIVIGVLGLLFQRTRLGLLAVSSLSLVAAIGLLERTWRTLATERLWLEGSCSMESGLPDWFALDRWFPAVFGVQASCGYTPVVFLDVTMAEALMAIAVLTLGTTLMVTIAVLSRGTTQAPA